MPRCADCRHWRPFSKDGPRNIPAELKSADEFFAGNYTGYVWDMRWDELRRDVSGDCRRFPARQECRYDHWCGEFSPLISDRS